jgi:hypothetical protein
MNDLELLVSRMTDRSREASFADRLALVEEVTRLRAENARLRDALERIRSYGDDPYGIARKALEGK